MQNITNDSAKIIQTDLNAKDGQNKCIKCGSTDISLNIETGKLRCNFCRHEFEAEKQDEFNTEISELEGDVIGSGAQDITQDAENIITLKCSSCGAEVVIDTDESVQARCHWCRNTLSINQQIPNGAIPDSVLPFKIKKEEAEKEIQSFVKKRRFFANSQFKKEFTTENIMGVYFPYAIVDVNSHARFVGKAERETRRYTIDKKTYYDADVYDVEREFDLTIDDLTVETNLDRLDRNSSSKTNNIINSIMPFDTENCIKWDANYLKGYSSEKRDTNIDQLRPLVNTQAKDVARFSVNRSLTFYDRGARWHTQDLDIKGTRWKTAYLPVWLYSYQEVKSDNKKLLHYVAVNARSKETMGSVPIHMPKLVLISILISLLCILFFMPIVIDDGDNAEILIYGGLTGFIFFGFMKAKYRNKDARHFHEKETKSRLFNLRKEDHFSSKVKRRTSNRIDGCNSENVDGNNVSRILSSMMKNS